MTTGLLHEMEKVIERQHGAWLAQIIYRYGLEVKIKRPVADTYRDVYGTSAGEEYSQDHGTIEAAIIGDDFFASDNRSVGSFQEGIMYTKSDRVKVGDLIELCRKDCKYRRYKVMGVDKIGTTSSVFSKYRLSAIGD